MAYTTWDKVQARARMLLQDETADTLAPFITAAETWVDNKLRTVYQVPLTAVDQIVVEIATAEAAAMAIADHFSNRGRDEVTLAQDLHKWADENLTFVVTNTTLTAVEIPRPTSEARHMVKSTTPAVSPMQDTLADAFSYRPQTGGYPSGYRHHRRGW